MKTNFQYQQNLQFSQINKNYFKDLSFFSKQFCLPKQIKLNQQKNLQTHFGQGIQIVQRQSIDDIQPIQRNVENASIKQYINDKQNIRFTNGDGLISLFKHRIDLSVKVRVAICVTVYSEDKEMLKKTLQGVKQNYYAFLQNAGILSHQIVVIVIFDGIQKINNEKDSKKNMVSLFRQFDLMNGFRKKQYLFAKKRQVVQNQMEQQINQDQQIQYQQQQLQNYNDDLLFTQKQIQDLQDNLFQTQYIRYIQMSKLVKYIKQLSKTKIQSLFISQLPRQIKIIFLDLARKFMEANYINNITDDDQELLQYLQQNMAFQKLQMLKIQAIRQSQSIALSYLKSREGNAILYQMTLPLKNKNKKTINNKKFNQKLQKMYTFFVIKHINSGKLSSHLWFFQGFCNIIEPDVCILIDCGLKPEKDAIFKMWAHIQTYKQTCGGVCGYMALKQQNPCDQLGYRTDEYDEQNIDFLTYISNIFVDIQKAQMFQYHFAHILDKPFQACFGYIHVLPGAFSGYNWRALKNEIIDLNKEKNMMTQQQIQRQKKQRILSKYLKTVIYNQTLEDIKQANMYLAEDRILCLQIYSKKKYRFNLQYLPDARSSVDPVTSLIRMLGQRKRWINGSWFALQYVLQHRKKVNQSQHNGWQKFKFRTNMFYSAFNKYVSYIVISFFFIIMHLMIKQFSQNQFKNYIMQSYNVKTILQMQKIKLFHNIFSLQSLVYSITGFLDFMYILAIGIAVFYSINLKKLTADSKKNFNLISSVLGIYGIFSIILVFVNFLTTIQENYKSTDPLLQQHGILNFNIFIYLFAIIVFGHILIILVTFDIKIYYQIFISLPSYFYYAPSYIHLLFIYAFCRIDDLSWGTKGLDDDKKKKEQRISMKFKNNKLMFVLKWLLINVCFSLFCITLSNFSDFKSFFIWVLSFYVVSMLLIRLIFALIYLFKYYAILRRTVIKETLNEQKKMQRLKAGLIIKQNLKNYIQDAKNYGLDLHIQQLKQDISFYRLFKKNIIEQENQMKLKQKIVSENHQKMSGMHNSQIQDDTAKISILSKQNQRKKNQNSLFKQKLYINPNDKNPILVQIFNANNVANKILQQNEGIQFSTLRKCTQLKKKNSLKKKFLLIHSSIDNRIQEMQKDQQSSQIQEKKKSYSKGHIHINFQQQQKFEQDNIIRDIQKEIFKPQILDFNHQFNDFT